MELTEDESQKKLFWGVAGVQYDAIWCVVGESAGKPSRRGRRPVLLPRAGGEVSESELTEPHVMAAWASPVEVAGRPGEVWSETAAREDGPPSVSRVDEPCGSSWDWLGVDLFDPWSPGFYAWEW
jgi:hypothetical protein